MPLFLFLLCPILQLGLGGKTWLQMLWGPALSLEMLAARGDAAWSVGLSVRVLCPSIFWSSCWPKQGSEGLGLWGLLHSCIPGLGDTATRCLGAAPSNKHAPSQINP